MILKHIEKLIVTVVATFVIFSIYACDGADEMIVTDTQEAASVHESTRNIEDEQIYVYVTGCVKKPDVYKVHKDCRIYEIIDMAGGFLEEADMESVNLADKAYDGMKITIYAIGEERQSDDVYEDNGLVNINTASKEQLMTLPGIGASKAESIINYRNENGRFQSVEDIMNISGIKEGAFSKLKALITI